MRRLFLLSALLVAFAAAGLPQGRAVHPITGRVIAQVMGFGGAHWLVRPERMMEEEPDRALEALKIPKGAVVADVGCGVGYFTWRLARRVGPQGKVYGVDIQPEMLAELRKNLASRRLFNVEPVLSEEDDPKLPEGALDLILMVDVYHEFSEPQVMLRHLRRALKPGGRLVLLEYRREDPSVPIRPEHKMSEAEVRAELEPEGFRFERNLARLPRQHILIFRPETLEAQ